MFATLVLTTLLHAAAPAPSTLASTPVVAASLERGTVLPFVEIPGLATAAAVVGVFVVAWETLNIPPKILFSLALTAGAFAGAAAVAGLVVYFNWRRNPQNTPGP
jgi:hypothetical protein